MGNFYLGLYEIPFLMKNISDGDNGNFDIIATKFTVHRMCTWVTVPLQTFNNTETWIFIDLWSRNLRNLQTFTVRLFYVTGPRLVLWAGSQAARRTRYIYLPKLIFNFYSIFIIYKYGVDRIMQSGGLDAGWRPMLYSLKFELYIGC